MLNKKMRQMLEQAQQMQERLQQELAEMRISASAGGGVVNATLNGNKELIELTIEPDAVDPDDVEMLQDLVMAAVNEAARRADEAVQEKIGSSLGGMGGGIPGLGGLMA